MDPHWQWWPQRFHTKTTKVNQSTLSAAPHVQQVALLEVLHRSLQANQLGHHRPGNETNQVYDVDIYIYVWVFPKIGVAPQIIHFNRVFHYKLSILGGFPPYFWKHPYIAKLKYFSNLDLPEIRGPISLPKRYLLGAQVVWGPGFKFQPSKRRSLPLQSKQGSSRGSKYRNGDIPSLKLTVCPSLPLKIGRNLKGKDRLPAFPAIQF